MQIIEVNLIVGRITICLFDCSLTLINSLMLTLTCAHGGSGSYMATARSIHASALILRILF